MPTAVSTQVFQSSESGGMNPNLGMSILSPPHAPSSSASVTLQTLEHTISQKQHQLAYIRQQQRLQQQHQQQLIFNQHRRQHQLFKFSNHPPSEAKASRKEDKPCVKAPVDLVDDVWQLVFYVLAGDCRDLGRCMQVNRRFYGLISNDSLLWKITYKLTVSVSIFSSQKPLLSPAWIREEQNQAMQESHMRQQSGQEATGGGGSAGDGSTHRHSTDTMRVLSGSGNLTLIAPGLQMPSPLVLPHHRRIAQNLSTPVPAIQPLSPSVTHNEPVPQAADSHLIPGFNGNGATSTPASTPLSHSVPSFQSTIPSTVSQVIPLTYTPISYIQHHIPTATLMHHPPAMYWRHQVVSWLEQEKLRCLRLGLFWGFNVGTSRVRGKKTRQ